MTYSVEIVDAKSGKKMATVDRLPSSATIGDVKDKLVIQYSIYYKDRQR